MSETFLREVGTDSLSKELEHVRALRARAERCLRESIGCSLPVTFKQRGASEVDLEDHRLEIERLRWPWRV